MKRRERDAAAWLSAIQEREPDGEPIGTLDGIPIYDATLVQVVSPEWPHGERDDRVVLGIGPEGGEPVVYVALCPCEGVAGLVSDLRDAGARAAEYHPNHAGEYFSPPCEVTGP
jgi:hypothetical protein